EPKEAPAPAPVATVQREARQADGRVKASPVARRMARDLDVELSTVAGSGPGGRIVKADVEAAVGEKKEPTAGKPAIGLAEGPATRATLPEGAKGEVQVVELNRLQQTIARRMAESKATMPHFYLMTQTDMREAV